MIWKPILALIGITAVIAGLAIAIPLPSPPAHSLEGDIVFAGVNVVDVESGTVTSDQDVFVSGGSIVRIAPAETINPANPSSIDGRGKYLIPGLWDMHTHSIKLSPQFHHPLLIANGVTSVRDMSGCMSEPDSFWACTDDRQRWNARLADGSGVSPRYPLQSSYQINGGGEVPSGFPAHFKANDVEGIPNLVAHYKGAGADFLKTYSEISPQAYHQLAREADENGLYLAGHRPFGVSLTEAIEAGQRSIEHPRPFLFECFDGAADYRSLPNPLAAYDAQLKRRMIDEHDAAACAALMGRMASSQTYWTPTMQVLRVPALAGDGTLDQDERLKYIPSVLEAGMWRNDVANALANTREGADRNIDRDLYDLAEATLLKAHQSGVKILIGTDAGDSYIYPGFAVHDELSVYVRAGISPQDALRMATIEAARFSGADELFGSVEVGKAADVVLLNANPYDDVGNTSRIEGVMIGGRYFDRGALDGLLGYAEQQVAGIQFNLQMIWSVLSSPLMRVQLAD